MSLLILSIVSDDVHGTIMILPVSDSTTIYTEIKITQKRENGRPKNHTESTIFRCKPDMRTFRFDRRQLLRTFAQDNKICGNSSSGTGGTRTIQDQPVQYNGVI